MLLKKTVFPRRVLFFLLFAPLIVSAQKKEIKNYWYVGASTQLGRVIPNAKNVKFLWDVTLYGLEVSFGKHTTGSKEWEQWFRYPDYGVALRYVDFDYANFGQCLALYGYMNGVFLRYKNFSLHYSLGIGAIYWPNHYDQDKNPDNHFIGSSVNAHIDLTIGAEYLISDVADLFVRANFAHSSNGAIALPNKGVNVIAAQAGLRYHIRRQAPRIYTLDSIPAFFPENSLYFHVAPGFRQSTRDHRYYYKQGIQVGYTRRFHPKYRYGAGVDVNYSGDLKALLPEEGRKNKRCFSQALFASFDVLYGRMALHAALGVYLYRDFDYYTRIYERIGCRFLLGPERNHFLGISIKAHGGTADYIEWTYGFQYYNWKDRKEKTLRKRKR